MEIAQDGDDVTATIETDGAGDMALEQVARILGLDVDAERFSPAELQDPVAAALLEEHRGLRPPSFWSPYEAAVWAILSQRVSMVQASKLMNRVAEHHGVESSGFAAFPPPEVLLDITTFEGLAAVKIDRLRGVARAALEGDLDGESLREAATQDAIELLQKIPGIGPFSADLILVRGAGHPDVFPAAEHRLHKIMRSRYDRPDATTDELADIAEAWRPYRSWVSFLFRSSVG